jgi:nicotinamide mononucleotide adenylyltransferase
MVKLAIKNTNWVKISTWEASNPNWSFTLDVLNHHKTLVQEAYGPNAHLMFLCGGDIVESFNIPNLWKHEHVFILINFFRSVFSMHFF